MTAKLWMPLSVRRGQQSEFSLVDNVPQFMRHGIKEWIQQAINGDNRLVALMALELRIDELSDNIDDFYADDAVIACIQRSGPWDMYDESLALDVMDWLLGHGCGHAQSLEHILKSAGHVLRVSPDGNRLVERIDLALWDEYEQVTQLDDQASQYMQGGLFIGCR